MAAVLPTVSRRIMKKIRVFGLRPNLTSTFLIGVALVVLKRGAGSKSKIFFLCEQVPIFVVLSSGSKKGSQPLPLPLLPSPKL